MSLLQVRNLTVEFEGARGRPPVRAVDDVSFNIQPRETVGLVGESGSGKSTIGRAILGLVPVREGSVIFAGKEITSARYAERRRLSRELQVVFQDPYSSLNPTRMVGKTLAESLRGAGWKGNRGETEERIHEMLTRVGLSPEAATRYPSNFSGGQRQRIAIARALIARPRLVVCDEPVSSLDLSVQAQVLNLLRELQQALELSYLFIAHDLAVVRHLSHRTIVLYRGRIMEEGPSAVVYASSAHPYTLALHEASPVPDPERQRARRVARRQLSDIRSPSGQGCVFASRCAFAVDRCVVERPKLEQTQRGSLVACHRWRELDANTVREAAGIVN